MKASRPARKGVLRTAPTPWRKFPDEPVLGSSKARSFGCDAVFRASGVIAQDDNFMQQSKNQIDLD
jgi:hypothetical protein